MHGIPLCGLALFHFCFSTAQWLSAMYRAGLGQGPFPGGTIWLTHNSQLQKKKTKSPKPRRRSLSLLEWALVKITFARSTGILLIVSVLRSWRSYWVGECWISCFSMMVFRYNKRRVPSIRHNLSVQGSRLCFCVLHIKSADSSQVPSGQASALVGNKDTSVTSVSTKKQVCIYHYIY